MYAKHPFVEELTRARLAPAPQPPVEEAPVREAAIREQQAQTSPFMLEIRLRNGDTDIQSYALLSRVKIREGGARWELIFVGCTVTVRGRNLASLAEMFRSHKLAVLQEGSDSVEGQLAESDRAFIESITIEYD